ncbi:YciI family protein [Massilia terrae]|uniref:YciI family protein n=1 Tax=Massilia terrae TaxID=1811224 RepID=A0ABT2D329_9BURK|nr:YciI family protein [Massilia terrae]MCS0660656.1 YciI family protein [Massilia terrae]
MFIISLTYTAPLEQIDAHLDAHRAFLAEQYASGVFLMSGRKVPRDGGIIIAHGDDRGEVEALVQRDPFWQARVAHYDIIEFAPTMTAAALAAYRAE